MFVKRKLILFWSCFFIVFKICCKYSERLPRCDWLKSQTLRWSRWSTYTCKTLKLVFYRIFFWWESDSISKALKFIWVNWIGVTSILIFHRFSCFWIEVLGCENIAKYKFKTQGFLKLHFMIFMIYYGGSERAAHRFST